MNGVHRGAAFLNTFVLIRFGSLQLVALQHFKGDPRALPPAEKFFYQVHSTG